jgi:4-hydroxybenzoate polyprenyltransferase
VSEQHGQRYEAAERAARAHGDTQVVRRYGSDTTTVWAVKSTLIAVAVAIIGYFLGGWASAVVLGVVWLGTAIAMRVYALRLKRRHAQSNHPSE